MKVEWSIQPSSRSNHLINVMRFWVKVIAKKISLNILDVGKFTKDEALQIIVIWAYLKVGWALILLL